MSKYSPLKVFHYPAKVLTMIDSMVAPLPPIHVRLKPTNTCNHHCSYCAYRNPDLQLGETMDMRDSIPREKMSEIVDDLVSMGVKAVTFSGGGDPFCYPWLLETAAGLHLYGVKFAALTNGGRLQGEVAGFFARNAAWLRVSIDGWDGESYAQYRGVGVGEFDRVLGNLAAFNALGGPCALGVVVNVDETNAAHVYTIIHRLATVGVKSVKIAPIVKSNDGAVNAEYHRALMPVIQMQVSIAQNAMGADYLPQVEISNGYRADLASYAKPYDWCPVLQLRPVIAADCNVYCCQDKAYNPTGLLFSVKEQSFAAGWNAGRAQFMRIDPRRDCAHHCAMDAINKTLFDFWETEDIEFV